MILPNNDVLVSPDITGLSDWIHAIVLDVEDNKYNGIVISARADNDIIYFNQKKFFKPL